MHYSVILNPAAGNGQAAEIGKQVQEQLSQANLSFNFQSTKDASSASYFARRLYDHHRADNTTVIVIGGDGTLHDVLNGLKQAADQRQVPPLPLAYIPSSRLSRFARAYGISVKPLEALQQVLAASNVNNITIGHCHDTIKKEDSYFLNSVGIGFDAALISQGKRQQQRKHFRWGRLPFFFHSLAVLYDQQPFQLMVTQGQHRTPFPQAYLVVINNHPFSDSGIKLTAATNLKTPSLDLTIAQRRGWPITLWQLRQFYRGHLPASRFASHFTKSKFHCTTTSLEFSQIDGNSRGNRFIDLEFSVSSFPFRQSLTSIQS